MTYKAAKTHIQKAIWQRRVRAKSIVTVLLMRGQGAYSKYMMMQWAGLKKHSPLRDHIRFANAMIELPTLLPSWMEVVRIDHKFFYQPKEQKHAQER